MPGADIPATILIVDDDALINIGTADMIEDMGLRALEAYSGREALDILERGDAIDLLITDYAMPGMTGVELADKARQLRPSLPVLLATGYDELPGGEVSDLPRLGKPFQQAELVACLQRVLATGRNLPGNGDPSEGAGASRTASESGLL